MKLNRILLLPTLAMLAGCSASPGEDPSSAAAAVSLKPEAPPPITNASFHQIPGAQGADVGSFGSGIDWVAPGGQEPSWSNTAPLGGTLMPGQFGVALDVGALGNWVLDSSNNVYGYVNGTFEQLPGAAATDIGVSPNGQHVYAVGIPGRTPNPAGLPIWRFNFASDLWEQMSGQFGTHVDAANDGSAYVTNVAGAVWNISGTPAHPTVLPIGQSSINAKDVTVGADGTVFVICVTSGAGGDQPLCVLDPGSQTFTQISGAQGTRVSASSATGVTVVNSAGQIWTTETTNAFIPARRARRPSLDPSSLSSARKALLRTLIRPTPGHVATSGLRPIPGPTCPVRSGRPPARSSSRTSPLLTARTRWWTLRCGDT